jgi:hypothetical protein
MEISFPQKDVSDPEHNTEIITNYFHVAALKGHYRDAYTKVTAILE